MALILGGFIFTDYAIPETVPQGGEHNFIVHKLPGGTRVVDAMGPDDSNITWHGRFQGPDALARAVNIDQMRKSGQPVQLVIDAQIYTVVIHKFEYDYQRFYQILYKITCLVTSSFGNAGPIVDTLDFLVSADMAQSSALTASFSNSADFANTPG